MHVREILISMQRIITDNPRDNDIYVGLISSWGEKISIKLSVL